MRYKELIQFEPITTVVKLVNAGELSVAENLVKTFVFSKKMQEDLREIIIKNLNTEPTYETKGIQVVGSYGTGKSHLMSLVSAIAENADLLKQLQNEDVKKDFKAIAGKYKVLRFEIGTDKPLKDIVFAQVERYLKKEGI
ncbi:MAG TPA: DUF6079 family protein, partial [Bacteroidia bacterium]|nr:DUF6079 family protein [Bacteroidia bacterium]